jgi:1-acyl-sn-glycerol-3-phosphate acyltransferase
MIRDAKGGFPTWLIDAYIERKLKGAFRGVWLRGEFPPSEGGLLVYVNHSSFWDGFLVRFLSLVAGWDGYAMMDEANLAKYRFHTRIGAFGIQKEDGKGALASIRYTREVLRRPGAAVVIFPEGEIRAGQGPIGPMERGVEVVARVAQVRSVPIAFRYAFLEHEYPDILVEIGVPHAPAPLVVFEQSLTEVYQKVMSVRSTDGFQRVLTGRSSVQERWDAVRPRRLTDRHSRTLGSGTP